MRATPWASPIRLRLRVLFVPYLAVLGFTLTTYTGLNWWVTMRGWSPETHTARWDLMVPVLLGLIGGLGFLWAPGALIAYRPVGSRQISSLAAYRVLAVLTLTGCLVTAQGFVRLASARPLPMSITASAESLSAIHYGEGAFPGALVSDEISYARVNQSNRHGKSLEVCVACPMRPKLPDEPEIWLAELYRPVAVSLESISAAKIEAARLACVNHFKQLIKEPAAYYVQLGDDERELFDDAVVASNETRYPKPIVFQAVYTSLSSSVRHWLISLVCCATIGSLLVFASIAKAPLDMDRVNARIG